MTIRLIVCGYYHNTFLEIRMRYTISIVNNLDFIYWMITDTVPITFRRKEIDVYASRFCIEGIVYQLLQSIKSISVFSQYRCNNSCIGMHLHFLYNHKVYSFA